MGYGARTEIEGIGETVYGFYDSKPPAGGDEEVSLSENPHLFLVSVIC